MLAPCYALTLKMPFILLYSFSNTVYEFLISYNMRWHFQFIFVVSHQSLKVVFREPLPSQPQPSSSPPPQLVSMYHHLESVINTACYNLWTGLL